MNMLGRSGCVLWLSPNPCMYGYNRIANYLPPTTSNNGLLTGRYGALIARYGSAWLRLRSFAQVPTRGGAYPQKALRGVIPCSFLEPFARSWRHFGGIYRRKLT